MNEEDRFPLEQWFDVTQPITKAHCAAAEEQIYWYALKDGYRKAAARKTIGEMKGAIRTHNATFQAAE